MLGALSGGMELLHSTAARVTHQGPLSAHSGPGSLRWPMAAPCRLLSLSEGVLGAGWGSLGRPRTGHT